MAYDETGQRIMPGADKDEEINRLRSLIRKYKADADHARSSHNKLVDELAAAIETLKCDCNDWSKLASDIRFREIL
jgi:hypothetical protein